MWTSRSLILLLAFVVLICLQDVEAIPTHLESRGPKPRRCKAAGGLKGTCEWKSVCLAKNTPGSTKRKDVYLAARNDDCQQYASSLTDRQRGKKDPWEMMCCYTNTGYRRYRPHNDAKNRASNEKGDDGKAKNKDAPDKSKGKSKGSWWNPKNWKLGKAKDWMKAAKGGKKGIIKDLTEGVGDLVQWAT